MTSEAQAHIQKFLYNLSTGNYSHADKELNKVITQKVNDRYQSALEKFQNPPTKTK